MLNYYDQENQGSLKTVVVNTGCSLHLPLWEWEGHWLCHFLKLLWYLYCVSRINNHTVLLKVISLLFEFSVAIGNFFHDLFQKLYASPIFTVK